MLQALFYVHTLSFALLNTLISQTRPFFVIMKRNIVKICLYDTNLSHSNARLPQWFAYCKNLVSGPSFLAITESSLDQLETQIFGAALRPLVVLHLVSLFDFPQGVN